MVANSCMTLLAWDAYLVGPFCGWVYLARQLEKAAEKN